ncbi:MAG: FAD:protein FMN transferase [Spirochaetia bacterium]|nr:FAD:protein FMN transferase [Spirochaetia bacterium]
MGTYYHVKWHNVPQKKSGKDKKSLIAEIENKLKKINKIFSTYDLNSELSLLNKNLTTEDVEISKELYVVIDKSIYVSKISNGVYDVTINPLINLWGFGGKEKKIISIPSKIEISEAKENMGYDKIKLTKKNNKYYIRKENKNIEVDLSSIAKGYAVDKIAELIENAGWFNYLVEIGGEIKTKGVSNSQKPWKIGINLPKDDAKINDVFQVLELSDKSLATSGTYRNYFKMENQKYSHILNAKTGFPVIHKVVSVSIIADSCDFADALATAGLILGEKSKNLFNELKVDFLIVEINEKEELIKTMSPNWPVANDP